MKNKFFWIFVFLPYVSFLLMGIYFRWKWFSDYENLVSHLKPFTTPHQLTKLKTIYLTSQKFNTLKIIIDFLLSIGVFLGIFLWIKQNPIEKKIVYKIRHYYELLLKTKEWVNYLPSIEKSIFFLVIIGFFVMRFFLAMIYPLTYDEMYIWEEFVSKGILVSISYYPIHGNHIFQTLLVKFFSFLEPVWALRLPSILASSLLDFFIFIYVYSKSNDFKKSILSVILFGLLYVNWLHSFLGRGYSIGLLFSFLILIIYEKNITKKFFWELVILQTLFLYTLPSAIFFLLPFWILEIKNGFNILKNLIFTFFFTTLLYAPVLFFLHSHQLLNSAYYQENNFYSKLYFFNQLWQFPEFWNLPIAVGILIYVIFSIGLLIKKSYLGNFFLIYLNLSAAIGLLSSFPAKGFMPLSFLILYFIVYSTWTNQKAIGLIFPLITGFLLFSNIKEFEKIFKKHFQAHQFAKIIHSKFKQELHLSVVLSPYDDSDLYFLALKHEYHKNRNKIHVDKESKLVLATIFTKINGNVVHKDENAQLVTTK